MTREETIKIIRIIAATYPNFKMNDISETVDAWYFFLSDFGYPEISIALKTYVQTNGTGFAPSASQLINLTKVVDDYSSFNENEAWALVNKAIKNSLYNSDQEFEKLPDVVKKAVGNPANLREWAMLRTSEVETVVASNFMRNYSTELSRAQEMNKMPLEVKNLISATIAKQSELICGNSGRRLLHD